MANNTINKEEIEKFNSLAEEWWNPEGKFRPLHKFNPIRIEYIKEHVIKEFGIKNKKKPFSNLEILDIRVGNLSIINVISVEESDSKETLMFSRKLICIFIMQ